MPPDAFFPPRDKRGALDFVVTDFPFPLALTYARLHEEMDKQEPIAAAWQLRDAFECLLKFTASVAVADCLHAGPDPEQAGMLASLLLKPTGLSLGDWHTLLEEALKPLEPLARAGHLSEAGRCLPELFALFFESKGRSRSALNRKIDGDAGSFVNWRNRVFGHGVFKQERQWYADETLRWLPTLHEFYTALHPVLDGWALVGVTPTGEEVVWQGVDDLPLTVRHPHEPWGKPLPMFLKQIAGPRVQRLPFGPLLSVQECALCHQPAAFFFDRNRHEKGHHRTSFLEYFRGHPGEHRDWEETRKLAALLPPAFEWQRTSYDTEEVVEGVRLVFRDFESEYLRPDYLLNTFWSIVEAQPKGYIHLVGPAGVGKTYVVRGLEAEGKERGTPVLAYHILPGALTDYRTFISELADRAREALRFRTQEAQTKVATFAELQKQFVEFVTELMRANRLQTLIVAIDALDELPDPEPNSAAITDFLPSPGGLPNGCFILLTSRDTLRPKIRECVERLREAAAATTAPPAERLQPFARLEVSPAAAANQQLLRTYLQVRLLALFRSPAHVQEVLERCGGVFLYAFHFCRALEAGVFPDVTALPDGHQFYRAYLDRLRERNGDLLFETVYLPVLVLLAATQQPVTLTQLHRWGIPRDKLLVALLDLNDFLRVHRVRRWHDSLADENGEHRYELAHEAFVRFVRDDPVLSARWREAHGAIANLARTTHTGHWADIDPTDDADLYDLRFVLPHLHQAGLQDAEATLSGDESYARVCWALGAIAFEKARHHLAVDLFDCALTVYKALVFTNRRGKLANNLASALVNKGAAMVDLGRLPEALACFEEVIALYRPLVAGGRLGLANDLAMALVNQGLALEKMEQWQDALTCYDEAISWQERCVRDGMSHVLPALVLSVRYRMMTLLDQHQWNAAAADAVRALNYAESFFQSGSLPEPLQREVDALIERLHQLPAEEQAQVYPALGNWAEVVTQSRTKPSRRSR